MVGVATRPSGKAEAVAAFAASLAIVVLLQMAAGAYRSGFGGHPDEPAHLVTALMIRDFLAGGDYRHPWQFAVDYYLHYPKVAIGHWPPVFYATAGVWFLVVGASRATALLFIAIVAAATATLVYGAGRRLIGRWAGSLAALLFLASPLVQESSARFMTEHPVTLAMLASTLCFARFVRTECIADGLGFGVLAALAILTRGSGWALALVPGLTIAMTRRWHLLLRPGLWLAALPVLVTCVPWYIFTLSMVEGSWAGSASGLPFWLEALEGFSGFLYDGLGAAVLVLAVAGFYAQIIRRLPRREVEPEWAALIALAAATFALQCAIPASIETRFMVTLVPSIVLFAAAGVAEAAGWLRRLVSPRVPAPLGLALATLLAFAAQSGGLPVGLRNAGFRTVAAAVAARLGHVPQVWLISSSATGEGSLIAAIALQEKRPATIALRGSNILATQDWLWRHSQDRYDTPEKLAAVVDEIPVTVVVIDDRIPPDQHRPYQDRLRALVTRDGGAWQRIGSYPLVEGHDRYADAVQVYARRPVAALSHAAPAIPLRRIAALISRGWLH